MLSQLKALFGDPVVCKTSKTVYIWENPTGTIFGLPNVFDKITYDGKTVLTRMPLYVWPDKVDDIRFVAPGLSFFQDEMANPFLVAVSSDWRMCVIITKLGVDLLQKNGPPSVVTKAPELNKLYKQWYEMMNRPGDVGEFDFYARMNYQSLYDNVAPVILQGDTQPSSTSSTRALLPASTVSRIRALDEANNRSFARENFGEGDVRKELAKKGKAAVASFRSLVGGGSDKRNGNRRGKHAGRHEGYQDAWYSTDQPWYMRSDPGVVEMGKYETGLYDDGSCMAPEDFFITMRGQYAERMGLVTYRMCKNRYQPRDFVAARGGMYHDYTIMTLPLLSEAFTMKAPVKVPREKFHSPVSRDVVDALIVSRLNVPDGNPSFAPFNASFVYDVGDNTQIPGPVAMPDPGLYNNTYGQ